MSFNASLSSPAEPDAINDALDDLKVSGETTETDVKEAKALLSMPLIVLLISGEDESDIISASVSVSRDMSGTPTFVSISGSRYKAQPKTEPQNEDEQIASDGRSSSF